MCLTLWVVVAVVSAVAVSLASLKTSTAGHLVGSSTKDLAEGIDRPGQLSIVQTGHLLDSWLSGQHHSFAWRLNGSWWWFSMVFKGFTSCLMVVIVVFKHHCHLCFGVVVTLRLCLNIGCSPRHRVLTHNICFEAPQATSWGATGCCWFLIFAHAIFYILGCRAFYDVKIRLHARAQIAAITFCRTKTGLYASRGMWADFDRLWLQNRKPFLEGLASPCLASPWVRSATAMHGNRAYTCWYQNQLKHNACLANWYLKLRTPSLHYPTTAAAATGSTSTATVAASLLVLLLTTTTTTRTTTTTTTFTTVAATTTTTTAQSQPSCKRQQ